MLLSLTDAKQYVYEKVEQFTSEQITEEEKAVIGSSLELLFFSKIEWMIPEWMDDVQMEDVNQLDAYMFNNIPKYATVLEETTAEFLSDYLVQEEESEESEKEQAQ